ncbi:CRISPR-associated CARF protein Csx1 [Caldicellulosiruptor morganii]|uniref:CRISPR-associated CARF protein Csx1 n=1 Tax=Caldicellulosiruptor morganii TaxID=1387555 RepID=A0ABY7BM45_9FIRM|nr:CRISPR-associated CARF protein Csx1 [Caldicellulosiruptor morganii]WAM33889.1 CRISPR-associated CARF protein Csx1 [Caldicellulosiruptor morganii]
MKVIYQIGRLDDPKKTTKKFFIESYKDQSVNFSKEAELSSFVLKDFLQSQNLSVQSVVIYPVSILLNKNLLNIILDEDLKSELEKVLSNPEEYLEKPFDLINRIELEKQRDDSLVIHSMGTYLGSVRLDATYDDIVLEILFDMIERYLNHDVDEFYIDISSGHNIYISAMMEASRYFAIFANLMNWLHQEKQPGIYFTFSDPIIGSSADAFEIHIQPQKHKAFFSSPIKKEEASDHNFSFLRRIYQEPNENSKGSDMVLQKQSIRQKRKALKEKIEMFVLLFSAIKNNAPLYLYCHSYHSQDEIKQELKNLIEHAKSQLVATFKSSPGLDRKAYLDAILSLGFYMGIVEVLESQNITMFCPYTGLDLEELGRTFAYIYSIFGIPMNYTMLGNEISNNLDKIQQFGEIPEWMRLRRIVDPSKPVENRADERNFFAHSGLEGNITEVRYDGEKVYVRYIDGLAMGDIDDWLKKRL